MRRGPLILAGLVLLSLIASIAAQEPGSDSPIPSIENKGPRGLAVLAAWLREAGGATVLGHDAPLTQLPPEVRVLVIAAPAAQELKADEVQALERFVTGGGTLVYLVARAFPQPVLNEWLRVTGGPTAPLVTEPGLQDVGGTTVSVTFAAGLLEGAKRLRLSADSMMHVLDPQAVPVTSDDAVWWLRRGAGEVWLAAGPDLAENARLELADNALFWGHLAQRGTIAFDEFHHHQSGAAVPVNLVATALQLLFLALLFVWARGARLGPPRDDPPRWQRSSIEYVNAMAALTRNANVDAELVGALKADFRRFLFEHAGIPVEWSWAEAGTELARRGVLKEGELERAANEPEFVALSKALAALELRVKG
jgi:hypothetical protein